MQDCSSPQTGLNLGKTSLEENAKSSCLAPPEATLASCREQAAQLQKDTLPQADRKRQRPTLKAVTAPEVDVHSKAAWLTQQRQLKCELHSSKRAWRGARTS